MIALIQRVTEASVSISGVQTASIEQGILALIGIEKLDTVKSAQHLAQRILSYRVFSDAQGRMNLDLIQAKGALLLVPQFTLVADTRKGRRPGFSSGSDPEVAVQLFQDLSDACRDGLGSVACGTFGADMQVALINDGPVTFWLRTDVS